MLRMGSRGQAVKDLQIQLNAKITPSPNLQTDGIFGSQTHNAVMAFQRQAGIPVDGIVGPQTLRALQNARSLTMQSVGAVAGAGQSGQALQSAVGTATMAATASQVSQQGLNLLKQIERLRLKPYDDQTGLDITQWVEGATIGYGHLISASEWDQYKDGITEAEANALFASDLSPFVNVVNHSIQVSQNQHQFDACVILAFNIGTEGFRTSSVAKMINGQPSNYPTLEQAWKAWNKSQGQVNQGLINRRNAEWKIYTEGVYQMW